MITCDTSFLCSLYLVDVHMPKARARLRQIREPDLLALTPLHEYELPNAIRLSVFRRLRDVAAAQAILAAFQADVASGRFERPVCNLASVLTEANRLSSIYTLAGGHRAFDILHIAVAVHFSATEFLTFDTNQRRLAAAVGLRIDP